MTTQTNLGQTPEWRPQLAGRVCPTCGTHYSADACPVCALGHRIKMMRAKLDNMENTL